MTKQRALVRLRSGPFTDDSRAATAALLSRTGVTVVTEIPPGGVVVDATDQQLRGLEAEGCRVKLLAEPGVLEVGIYRIDVEGAAPAIPAELRVPAELEGAWTHHLLQLAGPPSAEAVRLLDAAGVRVVEPVGRYGLFVVGAPEAVRALPGRVPFVTWAGPFQPAYRVAPGLADQVGTIRFVGVGVFPDADAGGVRERLRDFGATIVGESPPAVRRGLYHRLVAELDAAHVAAVASLPSVRWVEHAPAAPGLDGEREAQILAENLDGAAPPSTAPTRGYAQWLSAVGLSGAGVTIAICDTGVDRNLTNDVDGHSDLRGRQAAFVDYTGGSHTADRDGHGTHVAGIAVGNAATNQSEPDEPFLWGQGVAPGAEFVGMNALHGPWPPSDYARFTRDAVRHGASVMNNSWRDRGYQNSGYTADCRRFDELARDPDPDSNPPEYLVIVFSAGNAGPGRSTITPPHENKNTIVVGNSHTYRPAFGACDIRGVMASSSRGPARDGRILPTVVAPGTNVSSARSRSTPYPPIRGTGIPDPDHKLGWLDQYSYRTGTSMAAPHVAGACALLIEWWRARHGGRNPSPAMLKALLVNGAEDLAGGPDGGAGVLEHVPNCDQGWGRVSLNNLFRDHPYSDRGPRLPFDEDPPFTATGDERLVVVRPACTRRPLRVTLAWTDAPGAAHASPALVNDLDLEVVEVATGRVFKGNVFEKGYSKGGGHFDSLNNVECVYVERPHGDYEVRVIASTLKLDARPPHAAVPWQDYALVVDNADPVD